MQPNRVDREAKVIRGYSVMSLGEAKGHGMVADETTLQQLLDLGAAQPNGVKTRMRHPTRTTDSQGRSVIVHDGFGRTLGKSRNFRREGDRIVADLHLSDAAFKSPEGDLGTYVMELADGDEDTFGASPEVGYTKQKIAGNKLPAMRLRELPAIAIVDDPATNKGFFSCLSVGDDDMAETTALDAQVAELSAERDLLNGEVSRLKARILALEGETATRTADLSAARTDGAAKAIVDERNRAADVLALCTKAGKADLAAKHITNGTQTDDLQKALFDVLCAGNKPIGEGEAADLSVADPDTRFKAEFSAKSAHYAKLKISEQDYVTSRRIDEGLDTLIAR